MSRKYLRSEGLSVRLMIVDDHAMFRDSVVDILNREPDIKVIAQADDYFSALAELERTAPEILLLDLMLPNLSGIATLREIQRRQASVKTIILTGLTDRTHIAEALALNARGYVLKSSSVRELLGAIRSVRSGHMYLSPEVTAFVLEGTGVKNVSLAAVSLGLSRREIEVLKLVAAGMTTQQISKHMGIATGTVSVHRRNIRKKLGIRNTADATRFAIEHDL